MARNTPKRSERASNPATLRTFIALPLPVEWTEALTEAMDELRRGIPGGVRWVNPSGIHLTLKFLGQTDAVMAPRIVNKMGEALEDFKGPALLLSGLGTFPGGRNPRVIWAGIDGGTDGLDALFRRVEDMATGLGWPKERRPFRPHMTLGRVREKATDKQQQRVAEAIAGIRLPVVPEWRVDIVRLYRSELTPQGAIYSSLGEVKI